MQEKENENEKVAKEESEDILKKARKVGSKAAEALEMAKGVVKPGARLIDVAEKLEKFSREDGMYPAFPLNLSVNSEAAHYTPRLDDDKVFSEKDVVKVDFGVGLDGVLSDCAITIDLSGEHQKLVEAVHESLMAAISKVRAGVEVREIGAAIEHEISSRGYKPIKNLGGHGVDVHDLHAYPFIPNYDNLSDTKLEEGKLIAIEPFATEQRGRGMVANGDIQEIFSFDGEKLVRLPSARKLQDEIMSKYPHEPFAARWLGGIAGTRFDLYTGMAELVKYGAVESHPMLVEIGGGTVAQEELEVYVEKDGCEVVTKR